MEFKVDKLNWLYFDFDSYFASVEQQLNPEIRNKPVVVVPMFSDYTSAIAASYEAKEFGIKTGTKIYEAKKLCPELICVPSNHEAYISYHYKLLDVIGKCSYIDHVYSIDEGACKLTGELRDSTNAIKLARKIKQAIKSDIGNYITCSIGIASNKFVAKIASNIQKPNGLKLILPDQIENELCKLELQALPGIGKATVVKLNKSGIYEINQLYQIESNHLEKIWGSIVGKKYWYMIRGMDISEKDRETKTLSQSKILLPEEKISLESSRNVLKKLILKAAQRLRTKSLYTSKVTLNVDDIYKRKYKNNKKIPPSNDSTGLLSNILDLWSELISKQKIKYIKKISIIFCNLNQETGQQSLFDLEETKKQEHLSNIIDEINTKYKSTIINIGLVGTRKKEQDIIAFKHIPLSPKKKPSTRPSRKEYLK